MGLQIRRGTDAERLTTVFAEGEPVFTTDTEKLYIGDGVTLGGVLVTGDADLDPTFNSIHVNYTATVATLVFSGDGIPIISRDQLLGYTGSRGYTGSQGIQGDLGYTGSQGNIGFTGSQGTAGDVGFTGSQGIQGNIGYTGSQGVQGDLGYTGSQGNIGFTGSQGFTGSRGDIGFTGSRGGSSGRQYFFNYSRTEVGSYKELGLEPTIATVATVTTACAGSTSTLLASFASDPFDFILIPGGAQDFRLHLSKAASNNDIDAYCVLKLAQNDGTIISTVGTTSLVAIGWNTDANTPVETITDIVIPTTNVESGQRMIVEIYALNNETTSKDVKFYTEGNAYYSYVITSLQAAPGPVGYTGSQGYTGSAGSYDQDLNTTNNVVFKSVKTSKVVSAGGYPLDANGLATVWVNNTQSAALVVSNFSGSLLPLAQVRGYGQGRPGTVTTSTGGAPGMVFEAARGSTSTSYPPQSLDTLMVIQAGGYDGTRWSSDSNLFPFSIVAQARETFIGNATTITNAGAGFFIRTQPQGIQMNATSRQIMMIHGYTAGSTSAPSKAFINFGNADNTTPTLIHSNGTSTFTGYGSTDIQLINTKNFIFGVPPEDSAADNTTLTATNYLMFATGRRSGASGRRNIVQANDTLGSLLFYGQTTNNATSIGSSGGYFNFTTLETWSGSVRGTRASIGTINSGTTTQSNRLSLDNQLNRYSADTHRFNNAADTLTAASFNSSGNTLNTNTVITGHFTPNADSVYDLGSATNKWRSLYVSTSTIYIDGAAVSVAGGQLTIDGSTQIGPIGYTGSAGTNGAIGYTGSQGATGAQGPSVTLSSAADTASLSTSSGLLASITDGAGKLAYYNTTLGDWRYIGDDSDVYNPSYDIDYMVIAGGGGAAQGAGGAGGYSTGTVSTLRGVSRTVTIGAGGTGNGNASYFPTAGSNSSITGISTSTGGGYGGSDAYGTQIVGGTGGSGGGGAYSSNAAGGTASPAGQGNNGGQGYSSSPYNSGGGGGKGVIGYAGSAGSAGKGGNGASWFNGVTYAGGGGGASFSGTAGGAGTGGGGAGVVGAGPAGNNGTINTGGGGGGNFSGGGTGSGGKGIVIIRYAGSQGTQTGGTVTSAGGYTYHTFTDSGTFVS